ncbi:hypothetical protein GE061_019720 [Apolygus lucorum]|uniref:Uncharacterized protein n=1 Tax=Apolygus lucorum TaxID=248454 RepID=A0A8S9X974_APOLU|nr:hypothetical protein GE061_019720 [Apolygus lucorum]
MLAQIAALLGSIALVAAGSSQTSVLNSHGGSYTYGIDHDNYGAWYGSAYPYSHGGVTSDHGISGLYGHGALTHAPLSHGDINYGYDTYGAGFGHGEYGQATSYQHQASKSVGGQKIMHSSHEVNHGNGATSYQSVYQKTGSGLYGGYGSDYSSDYSSNYGYSHGNYAGNFGHVASYNHGNLGYYSYGHDANSHLDHTHGLDYSDIHIPDYNQIHVPSYNHELGNYGYSGYGQNLGGYGHNYQPSYTVYLKGPDTFALSSSTWFLSVSHGAVHNKKCGNAPKIECLVGWNLLCDSSGDWHCFPKSHRG